MAVANETPGYPKLTEELRRKHSKPVPGSLLELAWRGEFVEYWPALQHATYHPKEQADPYVVRELRRILNDLQFFFDLDDNEKLESVYAWATPQKHREAKRERDAWREHVESRIRRFAYYITTKED